MTKIDKNGKWSTATPLAAPISTKANEATCVLDEKGSQMYFTRCLATKNKQPKCQIYGTAKHGTTWDEPTLLPFNIDSFDFGHPAISKDEKIMIFSSNFIDSLNPGYGGLDLYYVKWDEKEKKWGDKPINLGPDINTPGEESYPFLHYDGTLYFASSYHLGMGGLDIFKSVATGTNKWGKPENMQYPINSAGDDFGIIFESKSERGYFNSNRAGGKGGDDIYSFILPPKVYTMEGYVTEELTKLPVPGATVKLLGSDNTVYEIKTDSKGHFKLETNGAARCVNPNTSYVVSASAMDVKTPDFPDALLGNPKVKFSTVDEKESKSYRQDFVLKKIVKNMRVPMVLFDLNKYDLAHPSNPKDSLEYLVKVMSESPNITIELSAHTDFRGDAKTNQLLSYNRAKTCVDYLITKRGIEPDRIVPAGYGESQPYELSIDATTPSGKIIPKGTILSEKWINANYPLKKNKDDFEFVMQMNRRVVFKILRKDYVSKGSDGQPQSAPEIKVTSNNNEGGEGDTKTEWDDDQTQTPQQVAPTTTTTPAPPEPAKTDKPKK